MRTRAFVRAPIALYRRGLGPVFGERVLMLEHRGRRSGQARYVCLEVVDRPRPDRIVVVSGFGEQAEWYRNLRADPACFVSVGRRRRVPAQARFMAPAEAAITLDRYRRAHPGAWERLRQAIEKAVGHPVGQLPMVELLLELV